MQKTNREFQNWVDLRENVYTKSLLTKGVKETRRKCFISYHHADQAEVEQFIEQFEDVFIPKVLGVTETDDFIDSTNTDYIMDRIREKYLAGSTVTIVLIGKCTWSRRYVDWEIFSTLRDNKVDKRGGLLAITLPSVADYKERKLPERLQDNVNDSALYARWWKYPQSSEGLKKMITEAFDARESKSSLIVNNRPRKTYNSTCP